MLPVFRLLGYDLSYRRAALHVGGSTYAISHVAGDDEGAPPVHIVAFDQELDRRGGARQSPHALVQDYLNRSDALWGVVTNGTKLRLLRNSVRLAKPTYVEFDLEAMLEGKLYSEFVLLWRLVHRTRLPSGVGDADQCWLERYYRDGIEQGGRVRDRLREGVEEALKGFGNGLLQHPDSDALRDRLRGGGIDDGEYYRQLLRLIYRLLFLMVAEERRLLLVPDHENVHRQQIYTDWYSIARLRHLAERRFTGDRHSDLWEGLKATFRLFRDDRTASQLGLTALDGELFGPLACAELEKASCRNDHLLRALFHLSTFEDQPEGRGRARKRGVRRRVNYAALDVEELGSVYESLLEYHPHVDVEQRSFDLVTGSERKQTGSYYTPHSLVMELIDSALIPVIEERLARAGTPEEKEKALLDLKVVDPAAGSGHFLLAAARRIGKELARVRTGEPEPAPEAQRAAIRDVVRHCLYAVDRNPLAVDLCKVALWIEGHNTGRPLSFLDHHVKLGDSLIGVVDLEVLKAGVPEGAYKPLTGDDKEAAQQLKKQNAVERKEGGLFQFRAAEVIASIGRKCAALAELEERSPADVATKQARYADLRNEHDWARSRAACNLWTAAFFTRKTLHDPRAVPTTQQVWNALSSDFVGRELDLEQEYRFFHWPLEFPEVFAAGGFDVALGNPPWDVSQLSEEEFFASRDFEVARLAGAERKAAIKRLEQSKPWLWEEYLDAKRGSGVINGFLRASGRFNRSAKGKINTYAVFAETFSGLPNRGGRAGLIVPTGIATDDSTKAFFDYITSERRLVSLFDFENREGVFPGVHRSYKFCLLTLGSAVSATKFTFFATRTEYLADERRRFTLSPEDIALINPNTKTCPVFRSQADAELTKKIYRRVPVLIDESRGDAGNPWAVTFRQGLFNMTGDSGLFRTYAQLRDAGGRLDAMVWTLPDGERWLPLYEAKMIQQFDHRRGSYASRGDERGNRVLPAVSDLQHADPRFLAQPFYWTPEREVAERITDAVKQHFFLVFRESTTAITARTTVAAAIPMSGVGHTLTLFSPYLGVKLKCALLANVNSLCLDYVSRIKLSYLHLTQFIFKQLPLLLPMDYSPKDLDSIASRVLELTYTAWDMQPFARDLGYEGEPFRWDPERRALLRAELDAYYAYLYGLSKKELRYVLDPGDVMGEDYPTETFRVLKEREIKEQGLDEKGLWRTQRLVLDAYDRFANDGTFDPARLEDPEYFPVVRAALAVSKSREQELERTLQGLVARAEQEVRPVLFVEGASDAPIVEAAWRALFPGQPTPFKILPAGGTDQMRSLAGKGGALKMALDKTILALADNDSAGRALSDGSDFKKLKVGGVWRQLENGISWCLLPASQEFKRVMTRFQIPETNWPCTVEQCFSAALRRQAAADGAYAVSRKLFSDLLVGLKDERTDPLWELDQDDDAYWYVRAPQPDCKERFAAWVADPARLTPANFTGFETLLTQLKELLAQPRANGRQPPQQRRMA
jgi:hypothetical protein